MFRVGQIAILTLICCSLPLAANRACADGFEIWHQNSYIYMPLPGTLGESSTFDWWFDPSWGDDIEAFGLPVVGDPDKVLYKGTVHTGPLLSLDAQWNADGSIGDADYIFGKGKFELELVFNLLDGTPHTMTVSGSTGPVSISVQDDGVYPTSNEVIISFLNAKVDPKSAALFGIKRQISGSTYYYTDTYNLDSPDRELALFGFVFFDYTSVKHSQSADLAAVPEPRMLPLIAFGVAVAIRRGRTRHART